MTAIKAHPDIAPRLECIPLSAICQDFVYGFCKNRDACSKIHKIVLVQDTTIPTTPVTPSSISNYLSLEPRVALPSDRTFDEDGPGRLSTAGARHDNDFESIKDIRILPTTDEVCFGAQILKVEAL